jgi:hypothetical protein
MILVGIATYKRPLKLLRLLESLQNQTYKDFQVAVAFDNNDTESFKTLRFESIAYQFGVVTIHMNSKRGFVIGNWNWMHNYHFGKYDGHMMLCDDVELNSQCLEQAVDTMNTCFPDWDGVVGILQEYPGNRVVKYEPAGQVLIGKKFLKRFLPDHDVCCPAYSHWNQDVELRQFAGDKFKIGPAKLLHHHPLYERSEMDETHNLSRGPVWKRDKEIFRKRQAKGLVWGKSWEI